MIGAGLLLRTVMNLSNVDTGFNRSQLVTFAVTPILVCWPLFTVSWNVSVAPPIGTTGAVKVGWMGFPTLRTTVGPATCVQVKVSGLPFGSLLPDPSNVTNAPSFTV